MLVHDDFSRRESFSLFIIHIRKEPAFNCLSVCHAAGCLGRRHRESFQEAIQFLEATALLAVQAIQKLAYRLVHSPCIRSKEKLFILWAGRRISVLMAMF